MIRKTLILFISTLWLTAALWVAGCSQAPKPVAFGFDTQKKVQASRHWQVIAEDVSKEIVQATDLAAVSGTSVTFLPNNTSAFCRGFRSFLATELIHSGLQPVPADMAEYQVDWSVQVVAHNAKRVSFRYPANTLVASLGYGVYKLFDRNSSSALGVVGAGMALDVLDTLQQIESISLPKNEIILTVSLKKGGLFVYRSTGVYYVNDMDTGHYVTGKDHIGMDRPFHTKAFDVSN